MDLSSAPKTQAPSAVVVKAQGLPPARALLVVAVAALLLGLWTRRPAVPPPEPPCDTPALLDGRLICDGGARSALAEPIGDRAWLVGKKLDVNTASARSLTRIPGVGASLAGRIVAAREERGGFNSVDELDGVPGVGPKMLLKLQTYVAVTSSQGAAAR